MEKLICVRPDHTVDFEYSGGVFKIGVLPRNIYAKYVDAGTKQLKGKMTGADMVDVQFDVVRYGIKGHSGLFFEDGEEVPFKTSKKRNGNEVFEVVSDETLEIYYATGLLTALFGRLTAGDTDPKVGDGDED